MKKLPIIIGLIWMGSLFPHFSSAQSPLSDITDSLDLGEYVVTGYQTISKERATGSYTILTAKELQERHATSLSEALDGLVPGMVSQDDGRGGKKFTIRGTSTLYADQAPLIVVDGFPITDNKDVLFGNSGSNPHLNALERINPQDVESITILKDAAAASIWGARSANGVIVITTKKARRGDSFHAEVSTQLTWSKKQSVRQLTGYTNSALDIAYQRWAFANGYSSADYVPSFNYLRYGISPATLALTQGYQGLISQEQMNSTLDALAKLDNTRQIKKELLRNPLVSQTNASLSGSLGLWSTRASAQFTRQEGDMIGSRDNTWNVDWNNQFRVTPWLRVNANINLVQNNQRSSGITLNDLSVLAPYEMLLNPDGSYAQNFHNRYNTDALEQLFDWSGFPYSDMSYNLLQEARNINSRTRNTQWRTQLGLQIDIMEGLQWNSKFQYERSRYTRRNIQGEESFATRYLINSLTPGYDGVATGEAPAVPAGDIAIRSNGRNYSTLLRNDVTLNRTFGDKHAVAAVVGQEVSNYYFKNYSLPYVYGWKTPSATTGPQGYVTDFEGDESLVNGVAADGKKYITTSWYNNRFVSFYGNASYVFDERYGISASARSDASNLITDKAKYRWSPLWSVGGMWNIANEHFMPQNTFLDRLTIRATYGKNGNAASTSSALTTIRYNSAYPNEWTGLYPGSIDAHGNPNLRWEKTATTNLGLDFSFFDGKLFGSFDYYHRKSKDVLGEVNLAAVNGTSRELFNNAEVTNHGLELALGTRLPITKDLTLTANFSYSYNKNKVNKLYVEANTITDRLNSVYLPGYPMYPIFSMQYGGVVNGVPTIIGTDGTSYSITDFSLWEKDWSELLHYDGSAVSPHAANLNISLTWKDITLSAYASGRFGGKMRMPSFNYSTPDIWYGEKSSSMIASLTLEDLMQKDGTVIKNVVNGMALPYPDGDGNMTAPYVFYNYSYFSNILDGTVDDASYIHLNEINLNWALPSQWLNGIRVNVFGQWSNVGLLWSANSKHYNPNYLPGTYKPTSTFSFGANVKF